MVIKNSIILKKDFTFEQLDVKIEEELIVEIGKNLTDERIVDGTGKFLIPGFIDIHTHGCVGFDTCDGNIDDYEKMSDFYASKGVTSFLFTTMSFSEQIISDILEKIVEYMETIENKNKVVAYPHGIYLEGPFMSKAKKGAQAEEYIIPSDIEMYRRLADASGNRIKVVAMAPEEPYGLDFIKEVSKDCVISIAHTSADYFTAMKAIEAGASNVTHLFNAMMPFNHREPGVIGAAFDSDVSMEIICDGIHLHPSVIRTVFKVAGADRVILISDSMQAAGMSDGTYSLGGQEVTLNNGKATLADGTIAGSSSNILVCVKNCISFGIPMEMAIKAATINPAKKIGIDKFTGSIEVGKYADLILIDENVNINQVFIKGGMH